jgi:Flp pilus assembly protein TadD
VEVLHQTISLASENPSAYFNLANAYVDVGNNDIALQTYRQVIELVPNHVSAHRTVAQILRDAGDTNGALHEFEILDTLAPDTPETLNAIAVLHAGSGRLETAEEFLRRAVSLSPDNHEFASNLANILARTFRTDEALTLYQGALDNPRTTLICCAMSAMRSAIGATITKRCRSINAHWRSTPIMSMPMPDWQITFWRTVNSPMAGNTFSG